MNLKVCLSPHLLPLFDLTESIVVVIDIFRASSSICYGIDNGATAIIPVSEVSECVQYKHLQYLLAAERNGMVVEGFDFGNSPFSYTVERVKGKTIVLTTTNGTRALKLSEEAYRVVMGSFLNLTTLCQWLLKEKKDVVLLCAGWKGNFCLEDTLFAGAVVSQLKIENVIPDDAALAAEDLYNLSKADMQRYIQKSSHSVRLKNLNIEKDVAFCLQNDVVRSIPVLENGRLVKLVG